MEKRKNQGQEWEDEEVIDLGEIFYALLRKLWVIIAVAVLGAGIGGAYSYFLLTPQYSSTAKIYVLTKETTLTSLADLQHAADTGLQDDHHRSFRYGRGG